MISNDPLDEQMTYPRNILLLDNKDPNNNLDPL